MDSWKSEFQIPSDSPGFLLWQVTNLWQRKIRDTLSQEDLTHVQFVLLSACDWLNHTEEFVSQVNLAHFTQTDVMMTSQVVRVLENKGLLSRETHPVDTRAKILKVTKTGEEVAGRARDLVEQVDKEFFGILDEQHPDFVSDLQKLLQLNKR